MVRGELYLSKTAFNSVSLEIRLSFKPSFPSGAGCEEWSIVAARR